MGIGEDVIRVLFLFLFLFLCGGVQFVCVCFMAPSMRGGLVHVNIKRHK
jgi:hypothetical protein